MVHFSVVQYNAIWYSTVSKSAVGYSTILHCIVQQWTVTVLWREEGFTMKYCLSPREFPRAEPGGFPEGSGNISLYTPTQVTIQSFSITSTSQFSQKLCQFFCQKSPETVIYQSAWRGPVDSQLVPLPPINMAPVLQSFSCSWAAQL